MGADAVRWALYAGTVPGQNTRFSDDAATDAVRELLLKIWNVYSFFVTYANIDGWDPSLERPALTERPEMDRWVLAELDATVRAVRFDRLLYRPVPRRGVLGRDDGLDHVHLRRRAGGGRRWAR